MKLYEIIQKISITSTRLNFFYIDKSTATPILIVLTHVDELEPFDLKHPDDYDADKLKRIEDSKQLFLINVANVVSADGTQRIGEKLLTRVMGVVAVSCRTASRL